jgi:hypothetical protein
MPDSKGEELQSLLRFEESVLQIKISLECKGTMVKNHFFQMKRKLLMEKTRKYMCGVAHM